MARIRSVPGLALLLLSGFAGCQPVVEPEVHVVDSTPEVPELNWRLVRYWDDERAQLGFYHLDHRYADWDWSFSEANWDSTVAPAIRWRPFVPGSLSYRLAPDVPIVLVLGPGEFGDDGLREIYHLQNLHGLDVGYTGVTDAGLKEIGRMRGLQILNLAFTRITDEGLKEIARLTMLQHLDIHLTGATDITLQELAGLRNLRTLNLGYTHITDTGLSFLGSIPDLRMLCLNGTDVTDEGVKRLITLKNLQSVSLDSTVTNAAVAELRKARPGLRVTHSSQ